MKNYHLQMRHNDPRTTHLATATITIVALLTILAGCTTSASSDSAGQATQGSATEEPSATLPLTPAATEESTTGPSPTPTAALVEPIESSSGGALQLRSSECPGSFRWFGIDVIVFLNSDVGDQDIDRITDLVNKWASVTSASFTSREQAFEEFVTMFEGTDQLEGVDVSDMPPSLRLSAKAGQEAQLVAPAEELRNDPAVLDIVMSTDPCAGPPCTPAAGTRWEGGIDLIVFLNPDVSAEDLDRITNLVAAWDAVSFVSFTSKEAAFDEFVTMFEGTDQLEGIDVSDMPPSLRLSAKAGQEAQLVAPAEELRNDPVIFEVVAPVDICDD